MTHIKNGRRAACDATLAEGDRLVVGALESGCNQCRARVNVGPVDQRGCAVTPAPAYDPTPHPDADNILKDVRARRA